MRTISSEALKEKIDGGDVFKLVMTLNEWAFHAKHIPGSIYLENQTEVQDKLRPEDEIVVYCTSTACSASIIAYEALTAQGFTNVVRYAGGIQEWEEAGYPTEGAQQNEQAIEKEN